MDFGSWGKKVPMVHWEKGPQAGAKGGQMFSKGRRKNES